MRVIDPSDSSNVELAIVFSRMRSYNLGNSTTVPHVSPFRLRKPVLMSRPAVILVLALLLLASLFSAAQEIYVAPLKREVIEERLRMAPIKNSDRQKLMKQLLLEAGCAPQELREQRVGSDANIICVMPGEKSGEIIVGAHFDHVRQGEGVVDNWTGAALLPSLLEALRQKPRRHTYVFVAFAQEEKGLVGSRLYVEKMKSADKARVEAMVNLDTLGLSPTKVWVTQADPVLAKALAQTASAMHLPWSEMNADGVGEADSISFRFAGMPSITIHSVTPDTLGILHSAKDTLAAVNLDQYYDTYRLMAGYLAYLDEVAQPRPAGSIPTLGAFTY